MKNIARNLDKFYTNSDIAQLCYNFMVKNIPQELKYTWLEPSAGTGVFFDLMQGDKIGIDIDSERNDILRYDFLKWTPNLNMNYVILGNPPFGKNSSKALNFLNYSAEFCQFIGFILPKTFMKPIWQDKINCKISLLAELDLPNNCFNFQGELTNVPTIFQIWQKTTTPRYKKISKLLNHQDFDFVDSVNADFAFQRVGARAGLVSIEGLKKSPNSHYFIKIINTTRPVHEILKNINWSEIKFRTAGNPSIGKHELICEYNKYLSIKDSNQNLLI